MTEVVSSGTTEVEFTGVGPLALLRWWALALSMGRLFFTFAVVFFESSFWFFVCYEAQIHWTCFTSISGSFQLCWDWRPAMPNVAPTDGWMLLNGPLVFLKSLNWLSFTLFPGLSLTLFDKGAFMDSMVVFSLRIYPIFHLFLAILSNCCTLPTVAIRNHRYTICNAYINTFYILGKKKS